jgi:hypothetical protein
MGEMGKKRTFVTANWKVRSSMGCAVEFEMREEIISSVLLGRVTAKMVLMALFVIVRSWGASGRAELKVHSSSLVALLGAGGAAAGMPPPRRSKLEDDCAGAGAGAGGEREDWNWKGLPAREFEFERAAKGSGFFCACWCCCCCWGEGVTDLEVGVEREPNKSVLAVCGFGGCWANIDGMEDCDAVGWCRDCENCAMMSELPMTGVLEVPFEDAPSEMPPPSPKLPSPMFRPRRSSSRALPALGGGLGAD